MRVRVCSMCVWVRWIKCVCVFLFFFVCERECEWEWDRVVYCVGMCQRMYVFMCELENVFVRMRTKEGERQCVCVCTKNGIFLFQWIAKSRAKAEKWFTLKLSFSFRFHLAWKTGQLSNEQIWSGILEQNGIRIWLFVALSKLFTILRFDNISKSFRQIHSNRGIKKNAPRHLNVSFLQILFIIRTQPTFRKDFQWAAIIRCRFCTVIAKICFPFNECVYFSSKIFIFFIFPFSCEACSLSRFVNEEKWHMNTH